MRKTFVLLLTLVLPAMAAENAFLEQFADLETRAESLAKLVPGSEAAFFHTALHFQLTGRNEDFKKR